MSLEQSILAEGAGYFVAVDFPGDENNPATNRAQAGNIILDTGPTHDEARRMVIDRRKSDRDRINRWVELGNEAKTSAAARDRLHAELVAAARLATRFPDAAFDVHDGSPWLAGRRMTFEAPEAAHRRTQQRAYDLAEQARRAADDARGGVSA